MMAGFTEPLSNGDPPSDGGLSTLIQEVDQLSLYVNDFQDHIDLELLVPRLIEHRIVTNAEIYDLQNGAKAPESRILSLITIILPRKGRNVLEKFKLALKDTVNQDGSQGHQELLQKYFAVYPDVHLYSGSGKVQPTAHTISDESEAFSILLIKIRKIMESGNEKEVTQRLKDVANYLCFIQVEAKNKQHKIFLLKESVRAELCSTDLSFSKLFHCLSSSNPPVISYSDISMLHKIIKTLEIVEDNKKMIERLKQLLHKYEEDAGIILSAVNPQVQNDCARIKAKVTNASSGGPKLKNGVKKSLFQSFWLGFRGSGVGSVIFYWDFPEEYILRVKDGLDNACNNKTELHQLKITRVKAQLDQKPYQIDLDMEITDPVLLEAAQKQHLVADDIAPEQEKFVLLLLKIGHLIGTCAELFLSTSRRELPRSYAQFERNSFKEMTGSLIFENKLHCYDISFIQQFLLSLLKWDTSQGSKNKELIIGLLKDTQEYEPVPTVSPLPSIQLNYKSNTVTAVTNFFDVYFVNYEVMMTLKYTLLQLLYLSPSAFQYVSWKKLNKGCQITWKTSSENFERIENKLRYHQSTAALTTCNDFEIDYPYKITFSCNIINRQILLDGSPLLCPDLEDCSLNVRFDMIHRVGHVCAACFIDCNWAFRLLWLQCFKPHEHQFAGKVNAVYDLSKSMLCRVRKQPAGAIEKCPMKNCTNGRKCTKAHSSMELEYWNVLKSGRKTSIDNRKAVSNSIVKHLSVIKNRYPIVLNPAYHPIISELSPLNYCSKFHHLLNWEELQHIEELKKRCVDPVDVVMCDDVTVAESLKLNPQYSMAGYVVMKDADSAKYVIQASQGVVLELSNRVSVEADIILSFRSRSDFFVNLKMEHVPIALNNINTMNFREYCKRHQKDISKRIFKVKAQFQIKHQYFQDLHEAVDNIPQVMIKRLFPPASIVKRSFYKSNDTDNSSNLEPPFVLDNLQSQAISSMLSAGTEAPFLLVGPFGTGKTHVLACVAAAIVKNNANAKILIATHHNKSADTFISKYFGTLASTKTLPLTVAPIRVTTREWNEDLEKSYFVKCNDPTVTQELLDERRIVVTTFLTALRFASTIKLPRGYFTHILIDEGAQTREPEAIAPLIFADTSTKVIIAGDHLQVGPKTLVLGQNAIKYGLAKSLVERLYNHYGNIVDDKSCSWIFNLLVNYRSHEAIMRLSSNLFYNSTVVSKSDAELHPITYYPLHFVCTSLNDGLFQNITDIHNDEAMVVINEVKRYTEPWPRHWGKREKSSVCIVASSRNQVMNLQQKVNNQIFSHSYIEVLPSYDIQGREFRAIFISTTEATDKDGLCRNPTKSITDPFVFNTVVTRAQSLVVCVGNPYFLCRIEEKMKPGNKCWSTYINSCLDCETFVCPNVNFGQKEKERLQNIVYSSKTYLKQKDISGDKIINGYLKSLAQFELHSRALKFSKKLGDLHWINCDDVVSDSEDYEDENLYCKCVIDFQSRYHALARSVDNPDLIIHINGQRNLRGAFHESTVLVEIIENTKQTHLQKKCEDRVFGRVVKLLSAETSTFLCEVDNRNFYRFYPTNKKDPVLYNLPTLSKAESGVAVFDPQSMNDVPRVLQVFPPQIAKKKIFVLRYLHWDPVNYKFPVGMAIDSISKGYTFSAGEKLLRAQYRFDFEYNASFKPIVPVKQCKADKVFTIVQKSGAVVENAFSVHAKDKNTYYVNFYVINVAAYIKDDELTDSLKTHGVSAFVKTDKLNNWKFYSMFPNSLLKNLNFILNEPRSCFKVSCLAKIRDGSITYGPLENPITEVVSVSTVTFTLCEVENHIESKEEFKILFHMARCLQYKRLGYQEAAYNCIFDISETPCVQLILKEFPLWANNLAANKLAGSSLALFPLYCKLPPNSEEKQLVYRDHGDALQTSVHNKYYLPKNGYKPLPKVMINIKALPVFLEALNDKDVSKYLTMLAYDNIFPQLYVASHKFRSIKRTKEYKSCTDEDDIEINFEISHDSECYTTMFTSPLTSYFDIVVQDMLSSAVNLQPSKYNKKELDLICNKANKDLKRKTDFEENVFDLQLGVTLNAFNHRVIGYIDKIDNKNRLALSFPSHELKNLSEYQSSFNVAHLFAFKDSIPASKVPTSLYKWKVKVASFIGPPSIFTSPNIFLSEKEILKNSDALLDITVFMASNKEAASHYYIELNKKQIVGSIEPSAVTVSQKEWQNLTNVMYNPTEEHCKHAVDVLSSNYIKYPQKVNFKEQAQQTVCWSGTVKRKLQQKYDPLFAWLGAAQDTAIIYPKIQQIEIAPFLKICIQHNSEPEKCFANVSLVNASKDFYSNIDEYIELWGEVVIAENAVSSVKTKDILLLENVELQWPKLEHHCDSYAGDHYKVPKNEYVVMKPPVDFNRSNIELFDLQRGDLLCVQYEVADATLNISMGFVFHMIVDKVELISSDSPKTGRMELEYNEDYDYTEEDDEYFADDMVAENEMTKTKYLLKFSQSGGKISDKFRSILLQKEFPKCQVQILHISPPQRRIYRNLCNLNKSSYLTQCIACGSTDAIESVQASGFTKNDISTVLNDKYVTSLWDKQDKKLSKNQIVTLRQACNSKFMIIHGPPGTGKSTVGAHLAYAFAKLNQITKKTSPSEKNRCVVYCGSSNVSVDVVAKMLCDFTQNKSKQQSYQNDKLKVLRVYPSNIERSAYPNPFDLLHDSASLNKNPNFKILEQHSLHHKIRNNCGRLGEEIKQLEASFNERTQKEKLASKADRMKYRDIITKAQNRILSSDIDILICTCNEMASARIFNNIEAVQVIIDEAAMVTEPESMIPVQHAKQVVLIGDHQQLQPKVHSRHAGKSGLITSLFQRYVDIIQYEPCVLNEQFRMHKGICEFPAKTFYPEVGLLTNQTTVREMENKAKRLKSFWPNDGQSVPFVFCDVVGVEEVTDTEFIDEVHVGQESKYNQKEAIKTVDIAKVLVNNYKVKQNDILVLSPYQAQCKRMHDILEANNLSEVKCTTVKSSEGNECGIVLMSTVRSLPLEDIEDHEALIPDRGWLSENLGFLTDKHIINVGITRCQYGLVIVGNKCLLNYDDTWSNLIAYCAKHRNVIPETQFPSRTDIEKIRSTSKRKKL